MLDLLRARARKPCPRTDSTSRRPASSGEQVRAPIAAAKAGCCISGRGEPYLQYNRNYGVGAMYDAMVAHIGGMARDIGLVERYGPNPAQQFRLQNDLATGRRQRRQAHLGNTPQAYWDIISGLTGSPESPGLAQVGQHAQHPDFGKLGGAVIVR